MNIYIPFIGMVVLTFIIVFVMYAKKLVWIFKNKVGSNSISAAESASTHLPKLDADAAANFKLLLKLPVIFYIICTYLLIVDQVDSFYIFCAYGFFIFRCLHSLMHCTINIYRIRYAFYIISSVPFWLMFFRSLVSIFYLITA